MWFHHARCLGTSSTAPERAWKNCEFVDSTRIATADLCSERERIIYGCEQLESALHLRREMQAKLQEISSLDPEYMDLDVEGSWEKISDTDKWSSPQCTMDNTTPTEDWSQLLQSDDTRSVSTDYSFLSTPGCHPKKLVEHQQSKDTGNRILDKILDNFEHDGRLDGTRPEETTSSRQRGLATLAFHWTNAEVFAGLQRKDLTSVWFLRNNKLLMR